MLENLAEKRFPRKFLQLKYKEFFYQTIKYFNNTAKIVLLMPTYAETELMFCLFSLFLLFKLYIITHRFFSPRGAYTRVICFHWKQENNYYLAFCVSLFKFEVFYFHLYFLTKIALNAMPCNHITFFKISFLTWKWLIS